jgi:hypothetical protein
MKLQELVARPEHMTEYDWRKAQVARLVAALSQNPSKAKQHALKREIAQLGVVITPPCPSSKTPHK